MGSRSLDAERDWSPLDDQFEVESTRQPPLVIVRRAGRSFLQGALACDFGLRFPFKPADPPIL